MTCGISAISIFFIESFSWETGEMVRGSIIEHFEGLESKIEKLIILYSLSFFFFRTSANMKLTINKVIYILIINKLFS